jgi:hypothetical protein
MSSISAGTSTGTALVSTGDTTGALQLQVNGTTPSVTLAANGSIGVGSTPGYGTSGQVLTSAGSAAAPTWTTPTTSGLVFISSQTVTTAYPGVASVDFTSGISSTYDNYQIVFSNFRVSTGAARIRMRLYSAGAWATSYTSLGAWGQSGSVVGADINASQAFLGNNNGGTPTSDTVWSGTLTLGGVNTSTSYASTVNGVVVGAGNTSASSTITTMGGTMSVSGTVTGFQLYFSTGSVWFGTVALYGMAKS